MGQHDRDTVILNKMIPYCDEIEAARACFGDSIDNIVSRIGTGAA